MDLGLQGRVAVIVGGSMGIGKAAALSLAAEGANIALIARTQETLNQVADEIRGQHQVAVLPVSADVTDSDSVSAAAAQIAEHYGTVNILVISAGHRMRRFDRQILWEDSDWLADIDQKTLGFLRTIKAFLPYMAKDGTGTIVNVGGIAGKMIWESALTHGINNSAVQHISGYLAKDLAAENITVNTILPGLVATEWRQGWAKMMAEKANITVDEFLAAYCQKMGIISGRWASMEEIADTITFMASSRGRYFNGAAVVVDGGMGVNPR